MLVARKSYLHDDRRFIGRKFAEKEVQADIKHVPFTVKNKDAKPVIEVEVAGSERTFTPEVRDYSLSTTLLTVSRKSAPWFWAR